MKKDILICFDRDLTLISDRTYHLGRQKNWKNLIKILPNVLRGLKKLRKNFPKAKIYFITNQPGVAIKEFPLRTEKKAKEVCEFILKKFKNKGFKFNGYEICMRASPEYVKRKKGKYTFNKKMVGNFSCFKPKPGMIDRILKKEKFEKGNTKIYVLGDRADDVRTGLNVKGFGILTPSKARPKEKDKAKEIKSKNKYLSGNFSNAINFLIKREK